MCLAGPGGTTDVTLRRAGREFGNSRTLDEEDSTGAGGTT